MSTPLSQKFHISSVDRVLHASAIWRKASRNGGVDALGCHVNHLAHGLINESGSVCLIVSDVVTPYRSALLRELTLQLPNAGKAALQVNVWRGSIRGG